MSDQEKISNQNDEQKNDEIKHHFERHFHEHKTHISQQ